METCLTHFHFLFSFFSERKGDSDIEREYSFVYDRCIAFFEDFFRKELNNQGIDKFTITNGTDKSKVHILVNVSKEKREDLKRFAGFLECREIPKKK